MFAAEKGKEISLSALLYAPTICWVFFIEKVIALLIWKIYKGNMQYL